MSSRSTPARGKRSFSGLLSDPPTPLPDVEDDQPIHAEEPAIIIPPAAPAPDRDIVATPHVDAPAATPPEVEPPDRRKSRTRSAPTTVRLRQSAADALEAAWLEERRTGDPRISATEFASRAVQAGLGVMRKHGRPTVTP